MLQFTADIDQAISAVNRGQLIAYPTEAVFGLGCHYQAQTTVLRLLELKQRPLDKGLILIAHHIESLKQLVQYDPEQLHPDWHTHRNQTWVYPSLPELPTSITGGRDTLAVRITSHPVAARIAQACGPLVSTSANLSQGAESRSAEAVLQIFPTDLDLILDQACGTQAKPSVIRHCYTGEYFRK